MAWQILSLVPMRTTGDGAAACCALRCSNPKPSACAMASTVSLPVSFISRLHAKRLLRILKRSLNIQQLTQCPVHSKVKDRSLTKRTAKSPFPKWGRHGFDGNACGQEAYRGAFPRKWCKNNKC